MSYRKIFTVVNEQTASTVTARYAISLAVACRAELVLYEAHEAGGSEIILHHIERHLDHLYAVASALGIKVSRISEIGKIRTLLPKRALVEKADLVCYPLTPYKGYGADRQRQTVHNLMQAITSDLAIMRAISMAKPHPKNILVPFGKLISDREHRLLFIADLAKSFHAQVTLFHRSAERESKGMPDDITRFRNELQQQDVRVLERSGTGTISKAITVEAITRRNDLIVMGASERGVLRRMISGNPAGDVMRHPPCNAILFRAGKVP